MTDKIVTLVWELTIPADAPRQLLKLQTMDKVVTSYLCMMKVRLRQHAWHWQLVRVCSPVQGARLLAALFLVCPTAGASWRVGFCNV